MNGRTPTKKERQWMQQIRQIGCLACISSGLVQPYTTPEEYIAIHHIKGQRSPGAHLLTIPLCAAHHQTGPEALHKNKARFCDNFGSEEDLLLMAKRMLQAN